MRLDDLRVIYTKHDPVAGPLLDARPATLADLASRLGWLPCDICGGDGTVLTDNAPREWVRDRWPTLECHPCNGVGWLPSPRVLEAMAKAIYDEVWGMWPVKAKRQARAAWEAQARLVLPTLTLTSSVAPASPGVSAPPTPPTLSRRGRSG